MRDECQQHAYPTRHFSRVERSRGLFERNRHGRRRRERRSDWRTAESATLRRGAGRAHEARDGRRERDPASRDRPARRDGPAAVQGVQPRTAHGKSFATHQRDKVPSCVEKTCKPGRDMQMKPLRKTIDLQIAPRTGCLRINATLLARTVRPIGPKAVH